MSALKDLRTELVGTGSGLNLNTYTHVPGALALPAMFVMAGSPYIEQAQNFGDRTVRFEVVIAAATAANHAETEAADALIEQVVTRLEADDWLVEQVAQPTAMQFNNAEALCIGITVSTTIPALT